MKGKTIVALPTEAGYYSKAINKHHSYFQITNKID